MCWHNSLRSFTDTAQEHKKTANEKAQKSDNKKNPKIL